MSTLTNDHDLLIELKTKLDSLIDSVKEIKDGTTKRLTALEDSKLDKEEAMRLYKEHLEKHEDYEKRIRFLERYVWGAIALLGAIEIAAQLFSGTFHP